MPRIRFSTPPRVTIAMAGDMDVEGHMPRIRGHAVEDTPAPEGGRRAPVADAPDVEGHMPRASRFSMPPRAHASRTEAAGRTLRPLAYGVVIALANVALLATEALAGRRGP